jgi:S-(hydroxymethyl)glutathione dehydrogenase / alcohol dehydrogenase
MERKIRAAVLRQPGTALSVEYLETRPLAYGQVLVKMHYSGVCRSQLMEQKGLRGEDKWLPHLLGHEGLGIVEEIGHGVTKCRPGDQVILSWLKGAGVNAESATYLDENHHPVNSGQVTTFSTSCVVSENRVFPVPLGYSEKLLALFGCAIITGGGMAIKYGQSDKVDHICIIGFGGIGSAAALVLKGMGKSKIDIVEQTADRRTQAFNLDFKTVYSDISESKNQYDLVIEASGTIDAIEKGFGKTSDSGILVFASHPENGSRISIDPHDLIRGKQIFGSWGGDVNPDLDMEKIGSYLGHSKSNLELLTGEIFTIDEVNEAMAYLDSGKVGRPLLKLNEE